MLLARIPGSQNKTLTSKVIVALRRWAKVAESDPVWFFPAGSEDKQSTNQDRKKIK